MYGLCGMIYWLLWFRVTVILNVHFKNAIVTCHSLHGMTYQCKRQHWVISLLSSVRK